MFLCLFLMHRKTDRPLLIFENVVRFTCYVSQMLAKDFDSASKIESRFLKRQLPQPRLTASLRTKPSQRQAKRFDGGLRVCM